jgi:hypothetical protein
VLICHLLKDSGLRTVGFALGQEAPKSYLGLRWPSQPHNLSLYFLALILAYAGGLYMTNAAWALAGVIVGILGTGLFKLLLQSKQFEHDKEMFQFSNRGSEAVKNILIEMLNHRNHVDRAFSALRAPIGGYSDDEIRKLLIEVGAKKVYREDDSEWWYLLERQDEHISKKQPLAADGLKSYSYAEIRTEHANAYKKWTEDEDEELKEKFHNDQDIKVLATHFDRHPGAIRSRLRKLGLM